MKIGLFFGSFNPIHTGHLIIANHIIEHTEVNKIWFVVSPHNPHKDANSLLNEYDRFHLVELATRDNNNFRASNIEFQLPRPSYTIDTLTYLKEKFPFEEFSVIMGSDSFQNLPKWKNSKALMEQYPIIVYERPEFPIRQLIDEFPQVDFLKSPLLQISATHIRNCIKQNKSIRYLVHDDVIQYIEQNHYYK